jgi:hypothetical protein
MFGVLVVENKDGKLGYYAAYSGIILGKNDWDYFVPPIYDLLQPNGFFKIEEEKISTINAKIEQIRADVYYQEYKNLLEKEKTYSFQLLNDAKVGRFLDNYFVPLRKDGKWEDGLYNTVQAIHSYLLTPEAEEFKTINSDNSIPWWGWVLIILLILLLVVVFAAASEGTGSSWSSGGGGFSGGGSFGGGGGFGGGGASR